MGVGLDNGLELQKSDTDILILDTGGGRMGTVTSRAWKILERSSLVAYLSGYQNQHQPYIHQVVNAATKVHLADNKFAIFILNNSTLIEDQDELESLCVPFDLMRHGIDTDLNPRCHGGAQAIRINHEIFPSLLMEKIFTLLFPNPMTTNSKHTLPTS